MAAAPQYVLMEDTSDYIFLKKFNKNFLNKNRYLYYVWFYMCSK